MIDPSTLDFAKGDGLIPVVVQDAATLQVLTLAYMDRAALDETLSSGEATFFSRSRGGRWRKGETSGDRLHVVSIAPDCDADALVLKVRPVGNACHLNRVSCFGEDDAPGWSRPSPSAPPPTPPKAGPPACSPRAPNAPPRRSGRRASRPPLPAPRDRIRNSHPRPRI